MALIFNNIKMREVLWTCFEEWRARDSKLLKEMYVEGERGSGILKNMFGVCNREWYVVGKCKWIRCERSS